MIVKLDMTPELYSEVALTRNLPEYELRAGDIATLVDLIPHPSGGEEGCVLEVFNAIGESIAVLCLWFALRQCIRKNR